MSISRSIPALTFALLLAACGKQRPHSQETAAHAPAAEMLQAERHEATDTAAPVDAGLALSSRAASDEVSGRQLVRTADMRFQVKNVYQSALAIEDAVAAEGGFVVENRINNQLHASRYFPLGSQRKRVESYRTIARLTVRVPSERTLPFLRTLAQQMEFLDERNFRAEDIQFQLLRQQLAWQREQQISRDISRAAEAPGSVDEKVDAAGARALALHARDEAEVKRRELADKVAFATLTLQFEQAMQTRTAIEPDPDAAAWLAKPSFSQRIGVALQTGWRVFVDILVGMAYLWPLWLLLAIAAVALRRLWRHWRKPAPH